LLIGCDGKVCLAGIGAGCGAGIGAGCGAGCGAGIGAGVGIGCGDGVRAGCGAGVDGVVDGVTEESSPPPIMNIAVAVAEEDEHIIIPITPMMATCDIYVIYEH
jgi:hypothetical protein